MGSGYDESSSAEELLARIQEQYEPENMANGPWGRSSKPTKRFLAEAMLSNAVKLLGGEYRLSSVLDFRGCLLERYIIEFNRQCD